MNTVVLMIVMNIFSPWQVVEKWSVDKTAKSLAEAMIECREAGKTVISAYGRGVFRCEMIEEGEEL